jgi:hypothetical protein
LSPRFSFGASASLSQSLSRNHAVQKGEHTLPACSLWHRAANFDSHTSLTKRCEEMVKQN